jgi:serine/threonine-protein kinase
MKPERWHQITQIFDAARDREGAAREQFVAQACQEDPSLRVQVDVMLAAHDDAMRLGERPLRVSMEDSVGSATPIPALDVVRTPASAPTADIQELLHRRLWAITLISLGVNGFFNAMRFVRLDFDAATIRLVMVPAAVYLASLIGIAIALRRTWSQSTQHLRYIEAALFGITTFYFLGETYVPLFAIPDGGWMVTYVQRHVDEMSILARQPSIFWVIIIIAYGTFIPNTGRRCAVVTSIIGASPLILVGVAGVLRSEIPARPLAIFLAEMTMWMACAVAIAIYGSHKITALQAQALAARKLGQYQLKRRLGSGGMGEVFLAEHVMLKRPCAVKVIRQEQTADRLVLQRFLREVQVTATLTHPNTVQVFDYGQTSDGVVFYAMEFLAGFNLEELVGRCGPLPPSRAIFVLRQLCGALAEAHAIGLIHRDIKPTNVIVCSRGGLHDVAKLLDFGLVQTHATDPAAVALTQAGAIFGTPSYMSPEQAAGGRTLDCRTDIYSLGALACFLLTGQPPFVHASVVEILAAHINEPIRALRNRRTDLPGALDDVVLRCLAKNPNDRFDDVAHLDQALVTCHEGDDWTQANARAWWSAARQVPQSDHLPL